ncbi:MAG: hypothetical protein ACXWZF_05840 [Actinomycetota bacterium]
MNEASPAAPLESPVWFAPLRSPSWLLRNLREDATSVAVGAEPWDGSPVDEAGRDLRLGLPLYLAEALRFSTDARPAALREPISDGDGSLDASITLRTAVAPGGAPTVRVRVLDDRGTMLGEAACDAHDGPSLGPALATLPRAVFDAVAGAGVRPVWDSLYSSPPAALLPAYVRGQRACLRLTEPPLGDPGADADADAGARRRAGVAAVLRALGSLATSTSDAFPALLFFAGLVAARDAGSSAVGEFRLQANARCSAATDPHDPVYAIAALVQRVFGDVEASERRIERLRAGGDPALHRWLARVQAVT